MKKTFQDFGIKVTRSSGQEKVVCPDCSHTRSKKTDRCLSVDIDGGRWHCHHCQWQGGLGFDNADGYSQAPKTYTKPTYANPALPESALNYLLGQRKLTSTVLERNKIGFKDGWINFPYYKKGEVVNVKSRNGKKEFRQVAGCEKTVYKFDDIQASTIICEGEIDALSCDLVTGKNNAISVPDGAKGFTFFQSVQDAFDKIEKLLICVDNDEHGKQLETELLKRVGSHKCLRVVLPEGIKDANQCLVELGPEILKVCLDNPIPYPVDGVYYMADVDLSGYYENGDQEGISTGYRNIDPFFKLEKDAGQLITVTGIPGHGKSEFVDQLIINTANSHGWKWGVFSPENFPLEYHCSKLAEKLIGKPFKKGYTDKDGNFVDYKNRMDECEMREAQAWLHDHVYAVLPPENDISIESILKILKSLVFANGIRAAVIDPWNEINSVDARGNTPDHEWIGVQLTKLRRFARNHCVTIFVVAHPTKMQKNEDGSYPPPNAYDIKGSSTWRDKNDSILCVHRNGVAQDPPDYSVQILCSKVKKKFLGQPGMGILQYDFPTGRYSD